MALKLLIQLGGGLYIFIELMETSGSLYPKVKIFRRFLSGIEVV